MKIFLTLSLIFGLTACGSVDIKNSDQKTEPTSPAVEVKDTVYLDSSFEVVNKKNPDQISIQSTENIWEIKPKQTLQDVLVDWAHKAQWSVSYETEALVELQNTKPVHIYAASIDGAVSQVSKILNLKEKKIFLIPYAGNRVIRVFNKENTK